jgi:hypothetical protein
VTWTKLGAEFNSECARAALSDAAYRTHCEAIGWLYEVEETSCRIPKRLFRRFAGSDDAEVAVGELTGAGFWRDAGAVWVVVHHAGVVRQSIAAQQDKRGRDAKAQRRRRRKVSADISADVAAESVAAQSDRQTVGLKDHAALANQEQNHAGRNRVVAPELAERVRDRNGAAPSQSLRDHDGPEDPSSDAQQVPIPATRQSQAADRNARTRGAQ